jgi:hypothetical protein
MGSGREMLNQSLAGGRFEDIQLFPSQVRFLIFRTRAWEPNEDRVAGASGRKGGIALSATSKHLSMRTYETLQAGASIVTGSDRGR